MVHLSCLDLGDFLFRFLHASQFFYLLAYLIPLLSVGLLWGKIQLIHDGKIFILSLSCWWWAFSSLLLMRLAEYAPLNWLLVRLHGDIKVMWVVKLRAERALHVLLLSLLVSFPLGISLPPFAFSQLVEQAVTVMNLFLETFLTESLRLLVCLFTLYLHVIRLFKRQLLLFEKLTPECIQVYRQLFREFFPVL